MAKICLLGDSIRQIGYGNKVAEMLKDEYEVWQPDDNCRFSSYTLRGVLLEWKPLLEGSDVIHWNNGLWDVCDLGDGPFTPLDVYVDNMVRIARCLKKYAKHVIFATSTPARPPMWGHSIERMKQYNAAVVKALTAEGVEINDLFTPVAANIEKYIREDDLLHLTDEGIELCAGLVVGKIREVNSK